MNRFSRFLVVSLLAGSSPSELVNAQIEKLPIGSIEEIVDYTAKNTDVIDIQVIRIGRKADGSLSVSPLASRDFSYDLSKGKLEDFVKLKIGECLRTAINVGDASLASARFGVSCIGSKTEPNSPEADQFVMFFAGNNFSLEKNPAGELVIPESASEVNVAATIAEMELTPIFDLGVRRVVIEVMDENGQVVEAQDSDRHQPGEDTVSVAPDHRTFLLPLKQIMGRPGRITITYLDGVERIFNLPDGKPYERADGDFRQLKKPRATGAGIEFYVEGREGDVITIETTADLGSSWIRVQDISGFSKLSEMKAAVFPINAIGRGFFRARVKNQK